MEIHILLSGVEMGPFSERKVREYLEEGLLTPSDPARFEGMEEWEAVDVVLARLARFVPASETAPLFIPPEETVEAAQPEPSESPREPAPAFTFTKPKLKHKPNAKPAKIILQQLLPLTESVSAKANILNMEAAEVSPLAPAEASPELPGVAAKSRKTIRVKTVLPPKRLMLKEAEEKIVPLAPEEPAVEPMPAIPEAPSADLVRVAPAPVALPAPVEVPAEPIATVLPNRFLLKEAEEKIVPLAPEEPAVEPMPAIPKTPSADPVTVAPEPVVLPAPVEVPAKAAEVPTVPIATVPKLRPPPPPGKRSRTSPTASIKRKRTSAIFVYAMGALLVILMICAFFYTGSLAWRMLSANRPIKPEIISPAATNPEETLAPEINATTAAEYDDRGSARQAKGNFDGAIDDFTQAVGLDPKDVQAYYRRGLARQAKGDLDGAAADYTQALALDPRQVDAYSNRGFVKQAKGDLDGAVADYTQALFINPKIAAAFYNRGLIKEKRGDLDGAILDYNHALDLDPNLAVAYYNRGDAKYAEGNLDGAIADYTQALSLNPKIALAYCHRGSARQAKGDTDGATLDYNQALVLNPKLGIAYYNRGLLKEQKGDLAGAVADTTQAIDLDPKDAQAYCNRGLARLGQNDLDEAMSDLKKFCQLAPRDNDADYARLYIWLISKMENPSSKADDDLATSLQTEWNSTPEDLESKIAAFVLGHLDENDLIAAASLPDPSQNPGQYCKARYFIGMKRLLAGDKANAGDEFRKCLATGARDFCEYTFAQVELRALSQSQP